LANTIGFCRSFIISNTYKIGAESGHIHIQQKDEFLLDKQAIRGLQSGYGFVCRTVLNKPPQKVKFICGR
jgi:hypothetical protein